VFKLLKKDNLHWLSFINVYLFIVYTLFIYLLSKFATLKKKHVTEKNIYLIICCTLTFTSFAQEMNNNEAIKKKFTLSGTVADEAMKLLLE
jgi:uncharacterized membrane protein YqhA